MQHGPRSCRTISHYSLVFSCTAQIYNNGYVSLGTGTTGGYTPRPFPFRGAPMIAPYWADVDTRAGSGRVYYRESASSSDRTRVSSIIRNTYHINFMPSRVFIVHWNRVGYYSRHQNRVSYNINVCWLQISTCR